MDCILPNTRTRAVGTLSLLIVVCAVTLSACSEADSAGQSGDQALRKDLPSPSIVANSSDYLNVAVHYVSYVDSGNAAVIAEPAVREMLAGVSDAWKQCLIGLTLEKYETLNPASLGETYNPGQYSEIDSVRQRLTDGNSLLMIASGAWGRNGNLGTANCYSSFPGDAADGVICEGWAAANVNLLAHEVGHWFNLRHTNSSVDDYVGDTIPGNTSFNLMESIIGVNQRYLTNGQCARARENLAQWRRNAITN